MLDIGPINFLDLTSKAEATKAKINKWDHTKLKASAQQRKLSTKWKGTFGKGENICKSYIWQGVNIKNIQTTHTGQYKKPSNPIKNRHRTE